MRIWLIWGWISLHKSPARRVYPGARWWGLGCLAYCFHRRRQWKLSWYQREISKDWSISYRVAHFARIEPVPGDISTGHTVMVGRLTRTRRSEHWSAILIEDNSRSEVQKREGVKSQERQMCKGAEMSCPLYLYIFVYSGVVRAYFSSFSLSFPLSLCKFVILFVNYNYCNYSCSCHLLNYLHVWFYCLCACHHILCVRRREPRTVYMFVVDQMSQRYRH